jgi:hypothetical protein
MVQRARGSFKGAPRRCREVQRCGQQGQRVGTRGTPGAPLQVADRAGADAGSLGQQLLRQAGGEAIPPQQSPKRGGRRCLHPASFCARNRPLICRI